MQQRRYLGRFVHAKLHQCEYPQLRSKHIIVLQHNSLTVSEQGIELLDKIRIQIQERLVEHLVERLDVLVYRRQHLYLVNDVFFIATLEILENVVLIFSGLVYIVRHHSEEQRDVLFLDLVRLFYPAVQ